MKRLFWLSTLIMVIVLASSVWGAVQAAPQAEWSPPDPPVPPPSPTPEAEAVTEPSQAPGLPPLKAVLLVGPIDGPDGSWTVREMSNMDLVATELEAHGVAVHKFYPPDDNWDQVRAAAEGAHFFVYRGHGVSWNSQPDPMVGGFFLSSGLVSPDEIRNGLKLAPNAIVMLFGCFTAGTADINEPITSEEARGRVAQYSEPFLDVGVAGYYANWYGNAFQLFIRHLFQGMTLGQAYEAFHDFSYATVERYTPPAHPDLAMWLDKDYWQESWQYNNAFAGLPNRTLADLFLPAGVLVTPPMIGHLAELDAAPQTTVLDIGGIGLDTFDWTAIISPDVPWLDVQPRSGTAGQATTVVIMPSGQQLGVYQASIHIVANAPGVQNWAQTIPVTLHVVEQIHTTYLPVVFSSAP